MTQGMLVLEKKNIKGLKEAINEELEYSQQEIYEKICKYFQIVFDYLMTIHLTSVKPERVFSGAELICTKIRSRLGDKTLDNLSFLRSC